MQRLLMIGFMAGLVCGAPALAQDTQAGANTGAAELTQACALTKCQRDVHVVLRQRDGKPFDKTFPLLPAAVQEMGIVIVAGQTLYIEAEVLGNRLVKMLAVDQIRTPERTITAKLEQEKGKDGLMILTLTNPFGRALKFNMDMMRLDAEGLVRTSSCPVAAGKVLYESWLEPIFQLRLSNPRLLDADNKMECLY